MFSQHQQYLNNSKSLLGQNNSARLDSIIQTQKESILFEYDATLKTEHENLRNTTEFSLSVKDDGHRKKKPGFFAKVKQKLFKSNEKKNLP